jgi:anti-sigma regulatory factor (Ser/Thr protein kinase)
VTAFARFELTSSQAELPSLAEGIEAFALTHGLAPRVALELQVVLDELIVNITQHGYQGETGRPIVVDLKLDPGMVTIRIEDEARPFDPLLLPQPDFSPQPEDRKSGGLGVYLVRKLMDEVEYERVGERNCLTLRKRV